MTHHYVVLVLLVLAACTAEPFGANPEPQFHMPLTYGRWDVKRSLDGKSCIVTSGYRGLEVEKTPAGLRVASVQAIVPGQRLSLNTNGHYYETSNTEFSIEDAPAIVADFSQGGKAYLRLRDQTVRDHILLLDDFAKALKQCTLKPAKKAKKKK